MQTWHWLSGVNSRRVSSDGNGLNSSSIKSVPPTPRSEDEILQSSNLKGFSFADLKSATRNFRPDSVLGEGGFGAVFKGWIDEQSLLATKPGTGLVIAVKRLNQESFQGHKEWLVSCWIILNLRYTWLYLLLHENCLDIYIESTQFHHPRFSMYRAELQFYWFLMCINIFISLVM